MSNVGNIKIEPVNASWQIEEQWDITCVADVASSLNNKYFHIYSGAGAKFHVWFNVATAGVDPAPSGSTAIVVAIAAGASAATVAAAVQVAVDANSNFHASVDGAVVKITCDVAGDTTSFADVDSGFEFVQVQEGGSLDIGYMEGDIEVKPSELLAEVTAHQTGPTPLAELRQGNGAEITLTMKECDPARLKALFSKTSGGAHTPLGGTEVFGVGKSRNGTSTIVQARRLVLHPVALAAATYTRDLCFWKAYPLPDTMVFSGENPQTISVTFKAYLDDEKPSEISLWCFGDWTQYVPVL